MDFDQTEYDFNEFSIETSQRNQHLNKIRSRDYRNRLKYAIILATTTYNPDF